MGAGHSPELITLYSAEDRLFISSDQVLPGISPNISVHAPEPFGDPLTEFLDSCAKLTAPDAQTYVLPIPKAALFGKQSFSLALSEAGVITSVEYGKNTGAASVLNAAGAAATAQAPETTAAKAADVKAQADLIAQQQRLARCQANPAQCQ